MQIQVDPSELEHVASGLRGMHGELGHVRRSWVSKTRSSTPALGSPRAEGGASRVLFSWGRYLEEHDHPGIRRRGAGRLHRGRGPARDRRHELRAARGGGRARTQVPRAACLRPAHAGRASDERDALLHAQSSLQRARSAIETALSIQKDSEGVLLLEQIERRIAADRTGR